MSDMQYTSVPDKEIKSLLDRVLAELSDEIAKLEIPHLKAVVLGGGYGRGEGGVLHTPSGSRLYNDLDFFVFSEGAGKRKADRINSTLKSVSGRWEKQLGIAVDFGPAKNLSDLRKVSQTLMFQELLRGWKPVWGEANLEQWIKPLEADRIPYSEAVRLLLNRGMGLLFAGNYIKEGKDDPDFILRNLNKAYLGGGDALLISAGKYRWKGNERAEAYREHIRMKKLPGEYASLYDKACQWKREPEIELPADPVGSWRKCRDFYMASVSLCAGTEPGTETAAVIAGLRFRAREERSLKNALRWQLRGGGSRSFRALFDPPVVTVLEELYSLLAENADLPDLPGHLHHLWSVFN